LSEQAYRLCQRVAKKYAGRGWQDVAHDAYLNCLRRGGMQDKLVMSRAYWSSVEAKREFAKTPAHYEAADYDLPFCEDKDKALLLGDIREYADRKYPGFIDILLANDCEQKATAKALGISQPAVYYRIQNLKRHFAA